MRLRPGLNWLIVIAIFIAVAEVFDNWICDIVAGIVLYFLLTIFLDKRTIGFRCPGCRGVILSNTPWVCKVCGAVNRNTEDHSFLATCGNLHCGVGPKAYRCHHKGCDEIIYFTADHDSTNYASCVNTAAPRPNAGAVKTANDAEHIEHKRRELLMEELEEKLRIIKERSKEPKVRTLFEQKKEKADQYYEQVMGMREYRKQKRAEAEQMYKDDADSLKKAYEAIDAAVGDHI
jgi:hypothetical protein